MNLLVLGATGPTGRLIVTKARAAGHLALGTPMSPYREVTMPRPGCSRRR